MSQARHFDVIIIGTGAGGGTLAYALAPSGKRILLLERGDYVAREKDNWNPRAVNVEGKYQTREVWRGADGKPLHPHTNYNVGGNTKFYGAALFRLRREDFGEIRTPLGVMLDEQQARHSRCIRCDTCDGFPCLLSAKADAHCAVSTRPCSIRMFHY
jgi:choline dehydrogenase-like flavoprotein